MKPRKTCKDMVDKTGNRTISIQTFILKKITGLDFYKVMHPKIVYGQHLSITWQTSRTIIDTEKCGV